MREDVDAASLSLPGDQDALIEAVAAANPNTIVVLETGGPVSMPWIDHVKGVVEMWYPGIGGAQALANILFGEVNPSGKLPVTFAKERRSSCPIPSFPASKASATNAPNREHKVKPFDLNYTEGAKVGYKWFESTNKQPLFPFGFGLSYTTYAYSGLTVDDANRTVHFTVRNTGQHEGTEIAQVYVALPSAANENYKRLVRMAARQARSRRIEGRDSHPAPALPHRLQHRQKRLATASRRLHRHRRPILQRHSAQGNAARPSVTLEL